MGVFPFGAGTLPDQQPAQNLGTLPAGALGTLAMAVANRNNARVDIPVIGDSITEGQGATVFANRWVQQANRAARAAYPTTANGAAGGQGFIAATTSGESSFTWPVSNSGSFANIDCGPVRNTFFATTTAALTWTAPSGTTSVKVMYFDGAGTWSWQVAAGGTTNVVTGSTFGEKLSVSISITGGQLLTLRWVAGNVYLDGIIHYASDESSGITFHACGHSGWSTANWSGVNGLGIPWQQSYSNGFPGVQAIAVLLGVNDAETSAGNLTAAQYQANLTSLIAGVRAATTALSVVPVLLVACYQPAGPFADPGGWPAYVTAARAVAAADTVGAHVIDLSYRLPALAATESITPPVPASTVTATNTSAWLPAAVIVVGGAVSNVAVNGSNVGSGPGTYTVPALGTIALTYTVKPIWLWSNVYADLGPGHPNDVTHAVIGEIVAAGTRIG